MTTQTGAPRPRGDSAILLIVATAAFGLAGCSKQQAVKSGLVDAGIPTPVADCMSAEMAKRLTVAQLQKLSRAQAGVGEAQPRTIGDYIERAQRVGDPEVIAVTGTAAAFCSVTR